MDSSSHFRFSSGSPTPNIFNFNQAFPTPTSPDPPSQFRQQQKLASQPRQIHRNRISYSCHACRRRKVKCDRQHPVCSNCTKTAESCVYDDHAIKENKSNKEDKGQKIGGGTKRRRTNEGASFSSEGGAEKVPLRGNIGGNTGTSGSGPTSATASLQKNMDIDKQAELETRMNRLAEIVDRWYKDASAQGVLPDGLGPRSRGAKSSPAVNDFTENGFAQGQHYLDLLQQSTGPIRHDSQSASTSPSPHQTPSPRNSTTPGSSISGSRDQELTVEQLAGFSRNGQLTVEQLAGFSRNGQLTLKIIDAKIKATKQSGDDDEVDDLGIGHLSIQGGGRSRYVGTSFWGLLSSEINELNSVLKTQGVFEKPPLGGCPRPYHESNSNSESSPTETGSSSWSPPAAPPQAPAHNLFPGFPGGCSGASLGLFNKASFLQFEPRDIESRTSEVIPRVLQMLPSASFSDTLYKSFLHGVHPVMPLLHAPTFDAQYKCFWNWYPNNMHVCPSGELLDNPTFLPLLMAVLYAGAISMSSKTIKALTNGETKETLTSRLYGATMSALASCAFPRSPTVNSLISFLIVQTCLIREEEPLTSCSFVGMAMRVAQSMGLHRDGSLFGLSEIECEVRRRVWWHIMYLDVQGAIATGLPPLGGSSDNLYDTKMVSELKDEYIGLPPGAPEPVTAMSEHLPRCQEFYKDKLEVRTSPAMILAVGRFESTILLRIIITRLFAIKGSKKSDFMELGKMIYELKAKLEVRISRIPARGIPEMGFVPPGGIGVTGTANTELEKAIVFNSWARIMLSLLSDRAFGVLYQPFLKSAKSTMWKHARNCALHFCHSFLRKFLHLSRTALFQPYQWFCPGTYQPLHATMILLLDLHERPFAPEAAKSRNFVDEVFAVFGEHGNYSTGDGEGGNRPLMEGGREAWRMLWRLRKKAYEKAGARVPEADEKVGGEGYGGMKESDEKAMLAEDSSGCPYATDAAASRPSHPIEKPLVPPAPAAAAAPAAQGSLPIGSSFEELLQMDTIIDAEDKAFFTDAIMAHFTQQGEEFGVDMEPDVLGSGPTDTKTNEEEAQAEAPQENQFDPTAERLQEIGVGVDGAGGGGERGGGGGGGGTGDMMDFDWEEWDQVFGKYVSVEVGDVL